MYLNAVFILFFHLFCVIKNKIYSSEHVFELAPLLLLYYIQIINNNF